VLEGKHVERGPPISTFISRGRREEGHKPLDQEIYSMGEKKTASIPPLGKKDAGRHYQEKML